MDLLFNIRAVMKDASGESFVSETKKQQKRIENSFTDDYTKKGKKCR
jgi:hypothetical protein